MSVEFFDGQRREMIAAIRVIAGHPPPRSAKPPWMIESSTQWPSPAARFVPVEVQPYAYLNRPLPIGFDKTISRRSSWR